MYYTKSIFHYLFCVFPATLTDITAVRRWIPNNSPYFWISRAHHWFLFSRWNLLFASSAKPPLNHCYSFNTFCRLTLCTSSLILIQEAGWQTVALNTIEALHFCCASLCPCQSASRCSGEREMLCFRFKVLSWWKRSWTEKRAHVCGVMPTWWPPLSCENAPKCTTADQNHNTIYAPNFGVQNLPSIKEQSKNYVN